VNFISRLSQILKRILELFQLFLLDLAPSLHVVTWWQNIPSLKHVVVSTFSGNINVQVFIHLHVLVLQHHNQVVQSHVVLSLGGLSEQVHNLIGSLFHFLDNIIRVSVNESHNISSNNEFGVNVLTWVTQNFLHLSHGVNLVLAQGGLYNSYIGDLFGGSGWEVVLLQEFMLVLQSLLVFGSGLVSACHFVESSGVVEVVWNDQTTGQSGQFDLSRAVSFRSYDHASKLDNVVLQFVGLNLKLEDILVVQLINEIHSIFLVVDSGTFEDQIHVFVGALLSIASSPPSNILQGVLEEEGVVPVSQIGKSSELVRVQFSLFVLSVLLEAV